MSEKKHVFEIAKGEAISSNWGESYYTLKLVGKDEEIKFCRPYMGGYTIKEGENGNKIFYYLTQEKNQGRNEIYLRKISLDKVQVKVILDDNCQYQLAVCKDDNDCIVLHKPSLIFDKDVDLKKYYHSNVNLVLKEKNEHFVGDGYVPYVEEEKSGKSICELKSRSLIIEPSDNRPLLVMPGRNNDNDQDIITIVKKPFTHVTIIKSNEGGFLAYFSDENGSPVDHDNEAINLTTKKDIYAAMQYNVFLENVLQNSSPPMFEVITLQHIKDLESELEEAKNKITDLIDESTRLWQEKSGLQEELEKSEEEGKDIEKVLLDVKEEFSKCSLAQKLGSITNKLQEIYNQLKNIKPSHSAYSSGSDQANFENIINNILSNAELLKDNKMKSSIVTTVREMLNMLKKCGSQSEEKLYLITDKIEEIKGTLDGDDPEIHNPNVYNQPGFATTNLSEQGYMYFI